MDEQGRRRGELSVWDAISLIIGIVIGSTIFKAPAAIFGSVPDATTGLVLWGVGGFLSLLGALCYAELGAAYSSEGGEYFYLRRAYGRFVGFQYGWSQLSIVQVASIGALASVFADYAARVFGLQGDAAVWLAATAVIGLTLLNIIGVTVGKQAQNMLSLVKIAGLVGLVAAGLLGPAAETSVTDSAPTVARSWQPLALILILYAYGGWNDAAFIVAEIRDPQRNVPRALVGGIGLVAILYLLINWAYIRGLGEVGVVNSREPAADVMGRLFGDHGQRAMSCLVMVSALGGVNGLVFTVSRLHAAVGREHPLLSWLGHWDPVRHVPQRSLLLQGGLTVLLIFAVGLESGRAVVDRCVQVLGGTPLPWSQFFGGFETLVAGSAPIFWLFFLLTSLAVVVQRVRDPKQPRPFRVPGYPVTPLLFAGTCGFMLYSSVTYAWPLMQVTMAPFVLGVPLFGISEWLRRRDKSGDDSQRLPQP